MRKFCYDPHVTRDNMNEVLIQALHSTFKEAKNWYPRAHEYAEGLAHKYKLSIPITAGIISCLSPQKNWFHNLQLAEDFLACGGCECRHVSVQVEKARRIYNLAENAGQLGYTRVDIMNDIRFILNGIKTQNFFMNIYMPRNPNFATIDVHMIQVMTGDLTLRECTDKQYEYLKRQLQLFAMEHRMLPSEMQSVLWITWRKIKPKRVLS